MSIKKVLNDVVRVIAEEAERNSEFARQIEEALGLRRSQRGRHEEEQRIDVHRQCWTLSSWHVRASRFSGSGLANSTSNSSRMWSPNTEWTMTSSFSSGRRPSASSIGSLRCRSGELARGRAFYPPVRAVPPEHPA